MFDGRLVVFVALVAVALCASLPDLNKHHGGGGGGGGGGSNFDSFKLTQIYPYATCFADDKAIPGICKLPEKVDDWTVHGLWPDRDDGTFPQFCSSEKFDEKLIKPIEERLMFSWPNLLTKKSTTSFWEHEYEKHGTCAASVPETGDELKYFSQSLQLHQKYNVYEVLKSHNIVPSDDQEYTGSMIQQALKDSFGATVQISCLRDKKDKEWLLGDVRMCLSKDFKVIDCPHRGKMGDVNKGLPAFQPCPSGKIKYMTEEAAMKRAAEV